MKNHHLASVLMMLLLISSLATAQIDTARNQSTQPQKASGELPDAPRAQLPGRPSGPMFPRGAGYPIGTNPRMWRSAPRARHALIGALIGFGLGTAIGLKGGGGTRAASAFGILGAGIGAGIGISIPSFPSRNPYWQRWADEDESASNTTTASPKLNTQHQTPRSAPSQSRASLEESPATSAVR